MANNPDEAKENIRDRLYEWATAALLLSWLLATAAIWTEFSLAPVGALATADVGRLVAIRGSTVTTTSGYFQVSANPSALLGTRMQVIRTNSPWSETGLQLCAMPSAGNDSWCSDISDGYAGALSATAFGRQAWSYGKMLTIFILALALTGFGWLPGAAVAFIGSTRTGKGGDPSVAT